MQTWWREHMCKRRFAAALQSSGSYVQFVIQCQQLCSRLLSYRWYCRRWTTKMPSWSVFTCSGDSSQWWTWQRSSSTACDTQTTFPMQSSPSIGSRLRRGTAEDGCAHVQGHSWNCTVIPESTGSCRRSAWSTFPPLCIDQSSANAVH